MGPLLSAIIHKPKLDGKRARVGGKQCWEIVNTKKSQSPHWSNEPGRISPLAPVRMCRYPSTLPHSEPLEEGLGSGGWEASAQLCGPVRTKP